MLVPELLEICSQGGLFLSIQRGKCFIGRSVVGTEELYDICRWERIAKWIDTPTYLKMRGPVFKSPAYRIFITPFHGGWHDRRRRYVFSMDFEHLSHEATGCPVAHDDLPAWTADTLHLSGYQLGARSKHGADQANEHIERAVRVGKHFRVALIEMSIQVFR